MFVSWSHKKWILLCALCSGIQLQSEKKRFLYITYRSDLPTNIRSCVLCNKVWHLCAQVSGIFLIKLTALQSNWIKFGVCFDHLMYRHILLVDKSRPLQLTQWSTWRSGWITAMSIINVNWSGRNLSMIRTYQSIKRRKQTPDWIRFDCRTPN